MDTPKKHWQDDAREGDTTFRLDGREEKRASEYIDATRGNKGPQYKVMPEMQDWLCDKIACGMSLLRICKEYSGLPSYATILMQAFNEPIFNAAYRRARALQAETLADQIIDISDECDEDTVKSASLRVGSRKWMASKLAPARFGDSVLADVEGATLTDDQLARRLAFTLLRAANKPPVAFSEDSPDLSILRDDESQ